jgi:hypothetical protein
MKPKATAKKIKTQELKRYAAKENPFLIQFWRRCAGLGCTLAK